MMRFRTRAASLSRLVATAAALLGIRGLAQAQCTCTCDKIVPACKIITQSFMNEDGTNYTSLIGAGIPGGIEFANQFTFPGGTTISHVCIQLLDPSGGPSGSPATAFIAVNTGGLPGTFIHGTNFTVTPTTGGLLTRPHQLVELSAPVSLPLGGTFWVGVSYPNAVANLGFQGSRPRTVGQSAVRQIASITGWEGFDNVPLLGYFGQAPVIRALNLGLTSPSLSITALGGNVPGITTESGGLETYEVRLAGGAPTSNVTIQFLSTNPGEGVPVPASVTFDSTNWTLAKFFDVVGQDDPIQDGDIPYDLVVSVGTSDPCYSVLTHPTISLINSDNDACGVYGWSSAAPLTIPPFVGSAVAAYDSHRGTVLRYGGLGFGVPSADFWAFDGLDWRRMPLGPPPLVYASGAFDTKRGVFVLHGGVDDLGLVHDETWMWDGTSWASMPAGTGPGSRTSSAMAYDPARDRMVLFGGRDPANSPLGDQWEFDGVVWIPALPPGPSPGPRFAHSMAFHPGLSKVVLFGGIDGVFVHSDSWTYDGGPWTMIPGPGPAGSASAGMAEDWRSSGLFLFGGLTLGGFGQDLWRLDSSGVWSVAIPGGIAPSGRAEHAFAFDASRGHAVLHSGAGSLGPLTDTVLLTSSTGMLPLPPASITACAGDSFTLSAFTSGGLPPLGFQWFQDGVPLFNSPHISGADSEVLTIIGANSLDQGSYWLVATDSCGRAISTAAVVGVRCPADIDDGSGTGTPDGGVDVSDLLYFLSEFSAGSADADLSDVNQSCTPDGGVDVNDLLYFLAHFSAGC